MKWPALLILVFVCLACGGMLPGKVKKTPLKVEARVTNLHATLQRIHLSVLEVKYLKENRQLNLAIVRGMILELEGKNPDITLPDSLPDLKEMRKRPAFLSLELTVEHLSHRESVKENSRHSAFL